MHSTKGLTQPKPVNLWTSSISKLSANEVPEYKSVKETTSSSDNNEERNIYLEIANLDIDEIIKESEAKCLDIDL